jgi:MFS transporter, DHA1 family, multidrug/chloramphenicol efflux transport protein
LALGMVGVPCLAWIALAPIIMITEAHLSVIEYGVWQLPIFGATILGNWFLHRLTYRCSLKTIIGIGCIFLTVGTLTMGLLPFLYGNHYMLLLPGVITYFFSISIITAPLNRYALFITSVSKGTASAILCLSGMVIGGVGIEGASHVYASHNNMYYGLYCIAAACVFLILIGLTLKLGSSTKSVKQA